MSDPIRGQRGLTYDLWQSIEQELRVAGVVGSTEFVDCPLGAQLEALGRGDLDLVISPLTITAERLENIDFTHQYLSSGLTVAQQSSSAIDFGYATGILRETLGHRGVLPAILVFLAANLVLAAFVARGLRHSVDFGVDPGERLPVRLCRYSLETMVRTIGLKGMGDSGRSTLARTVEVFMAVVGTVLSATIFGVLTTALVGSIGGTQEVGMHALTSQRVATLSDSTAQMLLEQLHREAEREAPADARADPRLERLSVRAPTSAGVCRRAEEADPADLCVTSESWQDAVELLVRGDVDLVLGDWAQLAYLARLPQAAGKISVQSATFRLEPYGWGVSMDRPELRAAIDRALMRRIRSTEWRAVVQEYMGSGSISPE
jgi:ABC-type amino acid transport substrate-binding protein